MLQDKYSSIQIIEYLKTPPSEEELTEIVSQLGIKAEELVRKNEALFKEEFSGKSCSEDEWIQLLVENPRLIERPIVITQKGARIGRPPENVLAIL